MTSADHEPNTLATGLICGGITLTLYLLQWYLAWRFLVPMWRAGKNPIDWWLLRVGRGHPARRAAALRAAAPLGSGENDRLREMLADDAMCNTLTKMGLDLDHLRRLAAGEPECRTCFFCERTSADPTCAYYGQKSRTGTPRKFGRRDSSGVQTYVALRDVRSMTFLRCRECYEIHERAGFELAWALVGGSVLFMLLAPAVVPPLSIWISPRVAGVALAILAGAAFVVGPMVAFIRGGAAMYRRGTKRISEARQHIK